MMRQQSWQGQSRFHNRISGPCIPPPDLHVWNSLQRLLAERARKIGGTTVRSIGQIAKLQTIKDNDESYVTPREMLRELMEDNKHVAAAMRKAHKLCDDHEDSGTASLLEVFIDETERRTWFLFEASRQEGSNAA